MHLEVWGQEKIILNFYKWNNHSTWDKFQVIKNFPTFIRNVKYQNTEYGRQRKAHSI